MKYIGIDLGTKTMGIATSGGQIATIQNTYYFKTNDFHSAASYLAKLINDEKFDILVIGYPRNMNNTLGHRVQMVDNFIDIFKLFNNNIKIELIDERLTTRMANTIMLEANLSRKKRKLNKDGLAAKIILESYLQRAKER